jgi:uncharacterized membrane protein HdeD (DUF308 family)
MQKNNWMLAIGVGYLIIAIAALLSPHETVVAVTYGVAAILLMKGIVQLGEAIGNLDLPGRVLRFIHPVLAMACAALIFWAPEIGMLGISMTLGFYFIMGGVMQWLVASTTEQKRTRLDSHFWHSTSGTVAFLFGLLIVFTFPISAMWVPGTYLALELFIAGAGLLSAEASDRVHAYFDAIASRRRHA